jgi:plastocyanin
MPARAAILILSSVLLAGIAATACDDDKQASSVSTAPAGAPATESSPGAAAEPAIAVSYAPAGPITFAVLAGSSDGNKDIEAFMPSDIRVRVGDTIEWTAKGFEGHTISFGDDDDVLGAIGDYLVPDPANPAQRIFNPEISLRSAKQGTHDGDGAFINSGFIGVPVEQKYSLSFTKPGLYTYLCLVHPFTMTGTVSVEDAGVQVESPQTVSARGAADVARYTAELEAEARRLAGEERAAAGPADATIHFVQVGAITDHGQVAVYTPGALDISAGDTVIFENDDRNFHNVIFKGDRAEYPPGIGITVDPDGRGLNFSLDNASAVAVDPPPEGFDDKTFLSSGAMGVLQPRLTWTLRFDKPGTYVYSCTIHVLAGMTGVINVQ